MIKRHDVWQPPPDWDPPQAPQEGVQPPDWDPPQAPQEGVQPPLQVKGVNGTVVLDEPYLTIKRTGVLARGTVGKGEKRIPLASITAVQWKPAGAIFSGFIQFTIPGGNEVRSRYGSQTRDATKDENTVVFYQKQQPAFEQLRARVEAAIVQRQQMPVQYAAPPAPAALEYMAQLQQLLEMRTAGLITDQEYTAKKADILARM